MWVFQPQSSKNRQICMKRESKFWYRLICQSSINPLLPILIWLIWRTRALVFPYRLICLNILLPAHLTHMPNKSLRPFIPTHLTHERLFSFENKSVEGSRPYPEICTTLHREPCCPLNSLQGEMSDSNPGHFPQQSVALPVSYMTSSPLPSHLLYGRENIFNKYIFLIFPTTTYQIKMRTILCSACFRQQKYLTMLELN